MSVILAAVNGVTGMTGTTLARASTSSHLTVGETACGAVIVSICTAILGYWASSQSSKRAFDAPIAKELWLKRADCYLRLGVVLRQWSEQRARLLTPIVTSDSNDEADEIKALNRVEAAELEAAVAAFGSDRVLGELRKAGAAHNEALKLYGQWVHQSDLNKQVSRGTLPAIQASADRAVEFRRLAREKSMEANDLIEIFEKTVAEEMRRLRGKELLDT